MRLSPLQIAQIRQSAAESFGPEARVWLFGSRVDDRKRGGDIDLLVQTRALSSDVALRCKICMLGLLESRLGEQKIDLVIEQPNDDSPIVRVAHETGLAL
ncbi:nucleotidyltransferase domain-containing protein [Acidithiobacillus thiooxidans]|uniref:nucleotidyltransferase domain-containing protein n=1 Tax=Acidithiobacillus TaxID=119977 RepID=UPI00187962D7|nr:MULTISPECIES: nucleotidyltransferase domain-containing protein [Acidithiobacillus]MBE7565677.1 nucleotidyltransferase domain-containing protein [Acidithiobacillus sp. HP-11]MBU2751966.1 nucleotidyltransferase domain-containing protein [Acidithiobacillus thiooxidans]MBU2792353.1 nucleotidyltransferase domain-containing protein [Acidithiobacillus thiooxidans]